MTSMAMAMAFGLTRIFAGGVRIGRDCVRDRACVGLNAFWRFPVILLVLLVCLFRWHDICVGVGLDVRTGYAWMS